MAQNTQPIAHPTCDERHTESLAVVLTSTRTSREFTGAVASRKVRLFSMSEPAPVCIVAPVAYFWKSV